MVAETGGDLAGTVAFRAERRAGRPGICVADGVVERARHDPAREVARGERQRGGGEHEPGGTGCRAASLLSDAALPPVTGVS